MYHTPNNYIYNVIRLLHKVICRNACHCLYSYICMHEAKLPDVIMTALVCIRNIVTSSAWQLWVCTFKLPIVHWHVKQGGSETMFNYHMHVVVSCCRQFCTGIPHNVDLHKVTVYVQDRHKLNVHYIASKS